MKKMMAVLGSALLLTTSAMTFISCGEEETAEKKVMNVSCNPSVEFVLDSDDKVVSVNALNEEGNLVISAAAFNGKSAEEAAKLFVEVSNETGFIVSGSATIAENEISISISGDTEQATELYNGVKNKVNEYLSAENITAQIQQAEAITKAQLEALVAECAPYLEEAEIKAMKHAQLVEQLYESRKETAEFYSQELKNAYYEAKAFVMEQAELEVLKSKVGSLMQGAIDMAYKAYASAVESIEQTRMEQLVNEDSPYQKALKTFREKKIEYLNYREEVAQMEASAVTDAIKLVLTNYENAVDLAETALLSAGESANAALDLAKSTAKTQYDAVVGIIETAAVKMNDHLTEINTKQQEAKTEFFTTFETEYAAAITAAKNDWTAMKNALEKTETENA